MADAPHQTKLAVSLENRYVDVKGILRFFLATQAQYYQWLAVVFRPQTRKLPFPLKTDPVVM